MQQIITVKAIIRKNDKVLLLRRAKHVSEFKGLYELPGGKVGFGQDPKAVLRQKVNEATSQQILTSQLSDVYSSLDAANSSEQHISLVFWVSVGESVVQVGSEYDKYVWKKTSEIQPNEVTDSTRTALQLEALSQITGRISVDDRLNVDKKTPNLTHVIINADGGSRGNPGPSASGFVIKTADEKLLAEGGKYLGITTNNQAEYQAVKFALEKALELGAQHAQVRLDSLLVVNQLNGIYQIRNRDLWPIHSAIKELVTKFRKVTFTHVRREFNKEADLMVNKILDEQA